jgi:hypothetical protein
METIVAGTVRGIIHVKTGGAVLNTIILFQSNSPN